MSLNKAEKSQLKEEVKEFVRSYRRALDLPDRDYQALTPEELVVESVRQAIRSAGLVDRPEEVVEARPSSLRHLAWHWHMTGRSTKEIVEIFSFRGMAISYDQVSNWVAETYLALDQAGWSSKWLKKHYVQYLLLADIAPAGWVLDTASYTARLMKTNGQEGRLD